ncbi:hypothetical protein FRX31_023934 [Thalictrum thalictroides]|uniref:Uncharacterized protein n=1 Tax=Thalictrum thalictroides TaxID=46969 RepID=A0A7J6VN11_THATH|nr:hypothetical protein FRX31_023934 [Thalictrum thalictroides]
MAHSRSVNLAAEKKKASSSGPFLPPSDLPKVGLSGKKRTLAMMKLSSEPVMKSPSPTRRPIVPEGTRSVKKGSNSSRGKAVSEVFNPTPFVYVDQEEQVHVMSSDSALDNPMVARAVNEGSVLPADADLVKRSDLLVMCARINTAISTVSLSN